MRLSPGRLLESLRTGFWAVPTACVVLAVALALAMIELDRSDVGGLGRLSFGAGPDGAREVLSAITTSMITFTGLVFSITIVVLQLTSSQFSPRVLRTFLRDQQTQWSLGIFVATFVYAVMVLRSVDSTDGHVFVPTLATTLGVVLLLVSVGVFIGYIHHIATAIQVSSLIRNVGDETRAAIARQQELADRSTPAPPRLGAPTKVLTAETFGIVATFDEKALVRCAKEAGVVLALIPPLGGFVPEGGPLLAVHGEPTCDVEAALSAVHLDRDRTMQQDVAFGFRQLVDVAERALSPGINDPTTAVQALDELHDLLHRVASTQLPNGVHVDDKGVVRLITRPFRLEEALALALDEIDQYGAEATQVQARIAHLLEDLTQSATPEHRRAVKAYVRQRAARGR